jgi:hypothetical protein
VTKAGVLTSSSSLKSNQAKENVSEPMMQNNGKIDARGVLKISTLSLTIILHHRFRNIFFCLVALQRSDCQCLHVAVPRAQEREQGVLVLMAESDETIT